MSLASWFARILQQRLQNVADEELNESQCGFRRGRECTDMILCARQLIEKSLEHEENLYLTFVDRRKVFHMQQCGVYWKGMAYHQRWPASSDHFMMT